MRSATEKQPSAVTDRNTAIPPAAILPPKSKAAVTAKVPVSVILYHLPPFRLNLILEQEPAVANKRKASEIEPQALPEIDSDDERLQIVDQNCDQVRRKIRSFLESGEMKVTEFQKEIGVNSRGFGSFMGQHGKFKGDKSNVYYNAFAFFKKRE